MAGPLDLQLSTASLAAGARPTAAARAVASSSKKINDPQHLRAAAREFEAVFLAEMLRPMVANLTPAKPFGAGLGEEMWRSLLADEYGKAIAAGGGIGIADAVTRELLGAQELTARSNQ